MDSLAPRESSPDLHRPLVESKTTPKDIEAILKQGEEDLFDLQRLIDQSRTNVPPSSQDTLAELDALMGEADEAYRGLRNDLSAPAPVAEEEDSGIIDLSGIKEKSKGMLTEGKLAEELARDKAAGLELARAAAESLLTQRCSLEDLEALIEAASDTEVRTALLKVLSPTFGAELTERVLNDQSYREELKQAQDDLTTPLKKGVAPLLGEARLQDLIATREIFGDNVREMAEAFDLSQYDERLKLSSSKLSAVFELDKDGKPRPYATLHLYVDGKEKGSGSKGEVQRSFLLKTRRTKEGEEVYRSVDHAAFKLDKDFQGDGLAAEMLSRSLEMYDKMGVKKITTMANIDLGGYAWQSYGFGWDEAGIQGYSPDLSQWHNEMAIATCIGNRIDSAKKIAIDRLKKMELLDEEGKAAVPEIQQALDEFDRLREQPLRVTPQDLGRIGRGIGPSFYRRIVKSGWFGVEEEWLSEEKFKAQRQDGTIPKEEAEEVEKNAYHLGKLGMASSDFVWYGKVDLEPGSPSRHLFEKKLKRSTGKAE